MPLVISGASSGQTTLAAPDGSTVTVTLPSAAGTLTTSEAVTAAGYTTPAAVLAQFNASGSAPVYACRAWVNFDGTGTVAIRASGNVSSITDNGTGDYTINFTTAMPDANYATLMTGGDNSSGTTLSQSPFNTSPTVNAVQVLITNSVFTATDRHFVQVGILR